MNVLLIRLYLTSRIKVIVIKLTRNRIRCALLKSVYTFVLGSRDKSNQFQNLYQESTELRKQGISFLRSISRIMP